MKNKKTKLTISGNAKKPIGNIELAKTQNKNSVVIEKKTSRFGNRSSFSKSTVQNTASKKRSYVNEKPTNFLNNDSNKIKSVIKLLFLTKKIIYLEKIFVKTLK